MCSRVQRASPPKVPGRDAACQRLPRGRGGRRGTGAAGGGGGGTRKFPAAAEAAYIAARDATSARAILTGIAIFLAFSSVVVVLWLGARDVLAGNMTAGTLSQFVLYAVLGASALGQLSEVWSEISAAAGSAGRISELLDVVPLIVSPQKPVLPNESRGEIAFHGVSFAYPVRRDAPTLH